MRFSSRVPAELTPSAWARRVADRRARPEPILDLAESNPTRVGLTADVTEVSHANLDAGVGYDPDPRGLPVAREAVARYCAARGATVDPAHVTLTSGTSEGYAHLFRVLVDPGEAVLAPRPSYPLFEPLARAEGIRVQPYRIAYDGRWHLDRSSLDGVARVRAVIAVQPNHPTGTCLAASERAVVEDWCERNDAALIADEVFGDYRWADEASGALTGFPTLLARARVPTFVLSGLSKVCGLPQVKASWIVASGPAAARDAALERLEWIADLFLSVSASTQIRLAGWLDGRESFQRRVRERLEVNRAALANLVRSQPALTVLQGEGGWVAALRLPGERSEAEWMSALLDRDVVVHPGYFYDFEFGPVAVLSLIVDPAVFRQGLERVADLVRGPVFRAGDGFTGTGGPDL